MQTYKRWSQSPIVYTQELATVFGALSIEQTHVIRIEFRIEWSKRAPPDQMLIDDLESLRVYVVCADRDISAWTYSI